MRIRLCYRIEKEAAWGEDEYGNPTEVYSCVKIDSKTYNVPKNEYRELIEVTKKLVAATFKVDEELIIPITLNEYLDNVGDE